jgi:hypothetical protein
LTELEALLQRLLIIVLLGRVFDDYCVISFTNLTSLLGLGLPFFWDLDKLRRRRRFGDELHQVILQEAQYVSTATPT